MFDEKYCTSETEKLLLAIYKKLEDIDKDIKKGGKASELRNTKEKHTGKSK